MRLAALVEMKRSYTRKEIQDLLAALERQGRDAARLAKLAEEEAARDSFLAYNDFRAKVGEFRSLCILIEGRLRSVAEPSPDLQADYARLDAGMLALLVRASLRFFFVLSAKTTLPLGARDIFLSELRSLFEASEKLKRPDYADTMGEKLKQELDTAEMILEEIIHKAPTMLSF